MSLEQCRGGDSGIRRSKIFECHVIPGSLPGFEAFQRSVCLLRKACKSGRLISTGTFVESFSTSSQKNLAGTSTQNYWSPFFTRSLVAYEQACPLCLVCQCFYSIKSCLRLFCTNLIKINQWHVVNLQLNLLQSVFHFTPHSPVICVL